MAVMPASRAELINYSVLVSEKLFNKFKENLLIESDLSETQLVGSTINVIGIPNLDIPISIIDGDIGVFADSLEVDKGSSEDDIDLRSKKRVEGE
ncbi:hypothetical protein [Paenibacillus polymyxa]|uniref:hypothetical protein n=1 Tax=Paenibacillus polymyxa TaxID=1406 RepID=UPI002AB49BC6|nr:hypothetical protein [Paenibacillus polymyxa]MDY8024290.1 hypothetical protein [Paenibacillus polymyxa]